MIQKYRNIPSGYKALMIFTPAIVYFLLMLQTDTQAWGQVVNSLTILSTTLGLHLLLQYTRGLAVFVITLAYMVALGVLCIIAVLYYYYTYALNDIQSATLAVIILGVFVPLVTLFTAYRFSKGRLWVNMFIASSIMVVILTVVVVAAEYSVFPVAFLIGAVLSLGFLIVRRPSKKLYQKLRPARLHKVHTGEKEMERVEKATGLALTKSDSPLFTGWAFPHNKALVLFAVIDPVAEDNSTFMPLIYEQLLQVKKLTPYGVPTYLWLVPKFRGRQLDPISKVSVAYWKQPDKHLGEAVIASYAGVNTLLKAVNGQIGVTIKPRTRERIQDRLKDVLKNSL